MPSETVTVVVCDGAQFGYEGRTYFGGDTLELPAEHVLTWLARGVVELPRGTPRQPHGR